MSFPKAFQKVLAIISMMLLWTNTALPCNVPVFRYALERWDADLYYALIVHGADGLTESEQSAYDMLRECSISVNGVINLDVYQYSRDALAESAFASLFQDTGTDSDGAKMYLFHPFTAEESGPVWSASLNEYNVRKLLADNDRLKLLKKITAGSSVVMLMLESGNPEKDDAAWQRLNEAVKVTTEYIALPEGIALHDGTIIGEGYDPRDPDNQLMSAIPLKLEFDLQRIGLTEENEVLIKTLLSVDPKLLESSDQPMVFPVFARGRFIYPMVGDEISEENVLYVSHYICGACSCEIKAQNPGMDLPILMDWEAILYGGEAIDSMDKYLLAGTEGLADQEDESTITISISAVRVVLLMGGFLALIGVFILLRRRLS